MPEPTIDEMLAWLHQVQERVRIAEREPYLHQPAYFDAIRAILEQHRPYEPNYDTEPTIYQIMAYLDSTVQPKIDAILAEEKRELALEAIRAFVERVNTRYKRENEDFPNVYTDYEGCLDHELAAMEKSNEPSTLSPH